MSQKVLREGSDKVYFEIDRGEYSEGAHFFEAKF